MTENKMTGRLLGDFKILEFISEGGMGAVYKACHKDDPEVIYALKLIRSDFSSDKAFISRFRQEERLIVKLSHPNIVRGYHFGEAEGVHYLAMEFIDGESLRARLEREKRLSPEDTLRIAGQVCSALKYAHGEKIIHRDIKPENILLRKSDDAALLTDFGLMKALGEQNYLNSVSFGRLSSGPAGSEARQNSEDGPVRKGSSPGTMAYMSPEQIEGHEISGQSDIFQLGIVLYECLTGKRPHGKFSDPSKHNPEVSGEFEKIILKCLEAEPRSRYGSAAGLNEALKKPRLAAGRRAITKGKVKYWALLLCCALACFAAATWLLKILLLPEVEEISIAQVNPAPEPVNQAPAEPPEAAQIPVTQPDPATSAQVNPPATAAENQEEEAKEEKPAEAEAKTKARAADNQNSGNASNCNNGQCNWYDAVAYCKSRGSRLPTVNELQTMYQAECTGGRQAATCNKGYWSSEELNAGGVRLVAFDDGTVMEYGKRSSYILVRCR